MEILKFVFGNFWTFMGVFLCLLVLASIMKNFFDFIVELIHGKQQIINYNLPKEIQTTKETAVDENMNKVGSKVKLDVGKVEVRSGDGKKEN